jgi:hypothetical protein
MIVALETAGFFVAIAAVLHFSSWAESWLAATAGHVKERAAYAEPSVVRDFPKQGTEQVSVRVA